MVMLSKMVERHVFSLAQPNSVNKLSIIDTTFVASDYVGKCLDKLAELLALNELLICARH